MGELINVVSGAATLPALFVPGEKAARHTIEFFMANRCGRPASSSRPRRRGSTCDCRESCWRR